MIISKYTNFVESHTPFVQPYGQDHNSAVKDEACVPVLDEKVAIKVGACVPVLDEKVAINVGALDFRYLNFFNQEWEERIG
jgi:hypothetical protein